MNSKDELPLHFNSPPGWPTPPGEWVATHQGWQPADGWAPRPDLSPAPPDWQFWIKNPSAWSPLLSIARSSVWHWFLTGALFCVSGAGLWWVGAASGRSFVVSSWVSLLFGLCTLIYAAFEWSRSEDRVLVYVQCVSSGIQKERDRAAYEKYLLALAKRA